MKLPLRSSTRLILQRWPSWQFHQQERYDLLRSNSYLRYYRSNSQSYFIRYYKTTPPLLITVLIWRKLSASVRYTAPDAQYAKLSLGYHSPKSNADHLNAGDQLVKN